MKLLLVSDYNQTFYINDLDIEKNKESVKELLDYCNERVVDSVSTLIDKINLVGE